MNNFLTIKEVKYFEEHGSFQEAVNKFDMSFLCDFDVETEKCISKLLKTDISPKNILKENLVGKVEFECSILCQDRKKCLNYLDNSTCGLELQTESEVNESSTAQHSSSIQANEQELDKLVPKCNLKIAFHDKIHQICSLNNFTIQHELKEDNLWKADIFRIKNISKSSGVATKPDIYPKGSYSSKKSYVQEYRTNNNTDFLLVEIFIMMAIILCIILIAIVIVCICNYKKLKIEKVSENEEQRIIELERKKQEARNNALELMTFDVNHRRLGINDSYHDKSVLNQLNQSDIFYEDSVRFDQEKHLKNIKKLEYDAVPYHGFQTPIILKDDPDCIFAIPFQPMIKKYKSSGEYITSGKNDINNCQNHHSDEENSEDQDASYEDE